METGNITPLKGRSSFLDRLGPMRKEEDGMLQRRCKIALALVAAIILSAACGTDSSGSVVNVFDKCDSPSSDSCVEVFCLIKPGYDGCVEILGEDDCAFFLPCAAEFEICICPDGNLITDPVPSFACNSAYDACVRQ